MNGTIVMAGLGVLLVGTGGGMALGHYATGEGYGRFADNASYEERIDAAANAMDAGAPVAAPDAGPENYTCHGCGPTLAQRQLADVYGTAPEPRGQRASYHPVRLDEPGPYEAPVPDPDWAQPPKSE